MKKTIFTLIIIMLVLALAACSSASAAPETSSQESVAVSDQNSNEDSADSTDGERQFSMPTGTALTLGTVKLDETDEAIDAEQAAALLPLWKALRSFSESETGAQAEVDAIISQIEDSLTPEQLSAIEAMQLTQQDMAAVAEILGVEMGGFGRGGFGGEMTEEMQATIEAARESGEAPAGRPGGDIPGSGQGPGGQGGEMDPAARETAMAERGVRGANSGINDALLDAIIEFLQAKTQ